ncbi:MAG: DUF58 domain-containing protein [Treponema sp.]|nr:DUF58 domain-containing protein [Treponema sp.]
MPRFRLFFTPLGGAVLVISAAGLIRALSNRNSYEIVLASAALLLLLLLGIIGMWKSKKLISMTPAWKTPSPMTAVSWSSQTGKETVVSGLDGNIPLFFRLHFFIKGKFLTGGLPSSKKSDYPVLTETSVKNGETTAQIPLEFFMSGVFNGSGYCKLCDIFGFFAFWCSPPQSRIINVRSAPCYGDIIKINAQTGAEDQRNKPAADIERYYMREYAPGDRFRDINWKSSEKIDTLITRISTDNQEKVSRLEVYFRNYGSADASMEALWLLDRAKARLSFFLRTLMEQNASFIFDIRTASSNAAGSAAAGSWEIQNLDELDLFFDELAGLSFVLPQQESAVSDRAASGAAAGDVYVFSTACDSGLQGFLLANTHKTVNLFIVQPAENKKDAEAEYLSLSEFAFRGNDTAVRFINPGKVKPLAVRTNKMEVFNAGIKI